MIEDDYIQPQPFVTGRVFPATGKPLNIPPGGLQLTLDGGQVMLPDNNPKSQYGVKKPALSLIPGPFLVILSKVMALGASKYGAYNWRKNSVSATVYVDAAERHLRSWFDGETDDEESGVSHLGHAAACLAILLDAQATGNLIDDRPTAGVTARLIKEHTV